MKRVPIKSYCKENCVHSATVNWNLFLWSTLCISEGFVQIIKFSQLYRCLYKFLNDINYCIIWNVIQLTFLFIPYTWVLRQYTFQKSENKFLILKSSNNILNVNGAKHYKVITTCLTFIFNFNFFSRKTSLGSFKIQYEMYQLPLFFF